MTQPNPSLARALAEFALTQFTRSSLAVVALVGTVAAQVDHHADGSPWNQRAESGPDAVVPGWYYNLGVTGLRVELVDDAPTHLVVRHVFAGSPAAGRIEVGDVIVGAGGHAFATPTATDTGWTSSARTGPCSTSRTRSKPASPRRARHVSRCR